MDKVNEERSKAASLVCRINFASGNRSYVVVDPLSDGGKALTLVGGSPSLIQGTREEAVWLLGEDAVNEFDKQQDAKAFSVASFVSPSKINVVRNSDAAVVAIHEPGQYTQFTDIYKNELTSNEKSDVAAILLQYFSDFPESQ